jgi:hypothetical protein
MARSDSAKRKPGMQSVANRTSMLLTALPLASALAFLIFFAHVRFTLGRWPVVYRDNPHGWLVSVEEVLATLTYLAAVAALVLWPVASGLAALLLGRWIFFRRLFLFLAGWALVCSLFVFDPTGSIEWFLD